MRRAEEPDGVHEEPLPRSARQEEEKNRKQEEKQKDEEEG